ncbi:MAG: hypothetical protein LN417_10045 [Candidatus Thermoplasmatota archaeon]|nr:hypothetical protein [Candidatus Thermoplasmatota archaeon]
MGLEDYEEELEKELEDYSDDEEGEPRIFTNRVCSIIIVVCIAIVALCYVHYIAMEPASEDSRTIVVVRNTTGADQPIWLKADCVPSCGGQFEEKGEIPAGGSWRGEFTDETVFTLSSGWMVTEDVPANGKNLEFVLEWLPQGGATITYSRWG